jgi:hypothetical protein
MRTDAAQPEYQPQTARHGDKRFVFTGPEDMIGWQIVDHVEEYIG